MLRFGQDEVYRAQPTLGSFKAYQHMRSNYQIPRFYAAQGPGGDIVWSSVDIVKTSNSEWSMFFVGTEEEFLSAVNEYVREVFTRPSDHGFQREDLVNDIRAANAQALGGGEEL